MDADQPFLRDRCNQHAVARIKRAPVKTARAGGTRRILRVEQPVIKPARTMKPHGVIKARNLQVTVENRAAMRMQGCIEQGHVGEIGENGGLQRPVIRHDAARPDPDMLCRLKLLA